MNIDTDIVFLGDSIVLGGKWAEAYDNLSVINLGISGDTIYGMKERVDMIVTVKPEKIFICGGINSLTKWNIPIVLTQYRELIEKLNKELPQATIYVQSVLPISEAQEKFYKNNETISQFNDELKKIAVSLNTTFIDINSLYNLNGVMNPYLTKDGIHLKSEAYDMWYEELQGYIYDSN